MPITARSKIIRAADYLFSKHGYQAITTKQIARRARVDESTIFRIFGDKHHLFLAVIESHDTAGGVQLYQTLDRLLSAQEDPNALAGVLKTLLTTALTPGMTRLMIAFATELPPLFFLDWSDDHAVIFHDVIEKHVKRLQQIKRINPRLNTRSIAMSLFMGIYGHAVISGLYPKTFTQRIGIHSRDVDAFVAIWLRGVSID